VQWAVRRWASGVSALCCTSVVCCSAVPGDRPPPAVPMVTVEPAPAGPEPPDDPRRLSSIDAPYLRIDQDGERSDVYDGATVAIARRPFSFVFLLRPYTNESRYSARFTADDEALPESIAVGVDVGSDAASTCFSPGMGIAAGESGYDGLYLEPAAHHYLVYEAGPSQYRRVRLLRRLRDGRVEVAFDVAGVGGNDALVPFDQVTASSLYLAAFFDDNLNQRIDSDELFRFRLDLD